MTERLERIFVEIPPCKVFADVGCDHGYVAKAMITSNKCEKVIISDISAKCLSKAQTLLSQELKQEKAISVVSNGLEKVPECDCVLIAGMGGEEIINIIKESPFLPQTLILQPMKNPEKVRVFMVQTGYKILKDFTFYSSEKYYDLLVLTKGNDLLTEEEIEFGRTNIIEKSQDFKRKISTKIQKLSSYIDSGRLSEKELSQMIEKREKLQKYV